MKLADLQKKRLRDVVAAHKRVLSELTKLEKQALKAIGPFVRAAAALPAALASSEKSAAAGQSELSSAWSAALKARQRFATAHDETLSGLDESLGVSESLEGAFSWVASDLPVADDLRQSLEEKIREAFTELRDVVAVNLEVDS